MKITYRKELSLCGNLWASDAHRICGLRQNFGFRGSIHREQGVQSVIFLELPFFFFELIESILLDYIRVLAWLKPRCMEVDRLLWIVLEAKPGHGLRSRNIWVSVTHEFKDNLWPVLLVVGVRHLLNFRFLSWQEGQTVWTSSTANPHIAVCNRYLQKFRRILVIRLTERNDFSHGFVVPICEWANDMWDISRFDRQKVFYIVSKIVHGVLVVLYHLFVLYLWQLRDARSPNEKCQDMLPTIPALGVLIRSNSPLPSDLHYVFEAQMPLND